MDKCFCHLNGKAVKDATARADIATLENSLNELEQHFNETVSGLEDAITNKSDPQEWTGYTGAGENDVLQGVFIKYPGYQVGGSCTFHISSVGTLTEGKFAGYNVMSCSFDFPYELTFATVNICVVDGGFDFVEITEIRGETVMFKAYTKQSREVEGNFTATFVGYD